MLKFTTTLASLLPQSCGTVKHIHTSKNKADASTMEQRMRRRKEEDFEEALCRGEAFIQSIVEPPQNFHDGLQCFKDVVSLENGSTQNIIVADEIEVFWSQCVDIVTKEKLQICASGSPGVGKSTAVMCLIHFLVLNLIRVVCLTRSADESSFH